MYNFINKTLILLLFAIGSLTSCEEFLDAKPSKDLVVPETISDFRAILNSSDMNLDVMLTLVASGEYYTTKGNWDGYLPWQQRAYLWQEDVFQIGDLVNDYSFPYIMIFNANVVLESLERVEAPEHELLALRGAALFYRAYGYYNLTQLFLPIVNQSSTYPDAFIPLKLLASITEKPQKGNIQMVLSQMENDLQEAISLLPEESTYPIQPNKVSSHALLARIYLSQQQYEEAGFHADKVLELKSTLIDYNEIDPLPNFPFRIFNDEVLFHSRMLANSRITRSLLSIIDNNLYAEFDENDLRRALYFTVNPAGNINFSGSYSGDSDLFSGLATNEMYLISAECKARIGNIQEALDRINELLRHRWKQNTYQNLETESGQEVLKFILNERKKELIFRGTRWADLKRLNTEEEFAVVLNRELEDETYTLLPNSPNYIFPIPPDQLLLEDFQ
ncbi:RagB/SusD family nutrient uptake outer membrane protein [Belliella sp. DSM 111904]|uniref:RagB/SusD family nutrient uptake outer membrane protein n=1 Tax=Belliella filtrata TaxID=2923435 RepID=A0ABS9V5Q7_9BACT|nr:RagB/SusD family nutrient uptake outer membrane protein [Belliella filtrata]MCH7411749.1 RagB/SusD family nutrient uptake outer membrane protein [Belliella filtrata]